MHRFLRPLLNLMILAGLTLAVWPLVQTVYGRWNQNLLSEQWQKTEGIKKARETKTPASLSDKTGVNLASKTSLEKTLSSKSGKHDLDSPTLTSLGGAGNARGSSAGTPSTWKRPPWHLTKLSIPDIALETFVVQGMDAPALRRGPGHDKNSSLPGEGNCVIAGHRNIYGSFFYRLDELMPGALIILENRDGKFTYLVDSIISTPDTNLTVLQTPAPGQSPVLTLITCTLPHTNNRIVLRATLSAS